MAKILIVDDQESQRRILADILGERGHLVFQTGHVDDAIKAITDDKPEVVITDLKMPGKSGLNLLEELASIPFPPEIIMVTAFGTVETAVKAIRLGVYDYLAKPVQPEELLFLIDRAVEKYALRMESTQRQRETTEGVLSALVARSQAMQSAIEMVRKIAPTDSTVLIRGETGTGKECIAQLIHSLSKRAHFPLKSINCAAFTESLLDSEVFGYEKGAFTGAQGRKTGIIETASTGTLFLDEIGDMSLPVQAKVLRVLQEKTIRRVGGTDDIPVDVRIIAATNKNLEEAIAQGRFREDLFYRLNVLPINLPPLRERKEDIPGLVDHFLLEMPKKIQMAQEVLPLLMEYPWPGNVRELHSIIIRAAILSKNEQITLDELPVEISKRRHSSGNTLWELPDSGIVFEELERNLLAQALKKTNGNMAAAAKLLGMTYRAFRYRANNFGLQG